MGLCGTLEYMSPEQVFEAAPPDERGDLYALGALAFRCFTGRPPYTASSIRQLILAFETSAPARPSYLRAGITPDMDA